MRTLPLVVAACLLAQPVVAQQPASGGIVFGDDHAFMLSPPDGWVLDNASGVSQGLHAVFYPVGSSWAESPVVMYVNTANKAREGIEGPEGLIAIDVARFTSQHPEVKAQEAPDVMTEDGRRALVRHFSGDSFGNVEAVAYVDIPKTVILVVLSARSRSLFDSSLPAFSQLVGSLHHLTDKVIIDQKN